MEPSSSYPGAAQKYLNWINSKPHHSRSRKGGECRLSQTVSSEDAKFNILFTELGKETKKIKGEDETWFRIRKIELDHLIAQKELGKKTDSE